MLPLPTASCLERQWRRRLPSSSLPCKRPAMRGWRCCCGKRGRCCGSFPTRHLALPLLQALARGLLPDLLMVLVLLVWQLILPSLGASSLWPRRFGPTRRWPAHRRPWAARYTPQLQLQLWPCHGCPAQLCTSWE